MKKKFLIILLLLSVVTAISAVAGAYAGGLVYLKLSNLSLDNLSLFTLYSYWKYYGEIVTSSAHYQVGLALAGLITVLPAIIILAAVFAGKKQELHGSARFANGTDLKKSGLFDSKEDSPYLLLGKMNSGTMSGKFVRLYGQTFVGLSAQTGSGKGLGFVIPNMVNYRDSILANDIKLENFMKSAGYRKSQGQEIFLFAPDGYSVSREEELSGIIRSHQWNPMYYVRRDSMSRVGDIQIITNSIYPLSGDAKSDIWPQSAGSLFKGLTLWMLDTESVTGVNPTIPYLMSLRSVNGGLVPWMKRELQKEYLSPECEAEFNKFIDTEEETRSGILTTFDGPLEIYSNPIVARAVSGNSFDFADLRKKGMTIYLGVKPKNLAPYSGLLNLFIEQAIAANTDILPEFDPTLSKQCLMMLDELPALGRINQIKTSIGYTRQYNLRYALIYQSFSQLEDKSLYGPQGAQSIDINLSASIIYPPKKVDKTVKGISETLGTKTVKAKSQSVTHGSAFGDHRKKSTNTTEQRRELMKDHEIIELGYEMHPKIPVGVKAILLKENVRPFIMDKIIYPFEKAINDRVEYSLANVPEIPILPKLP
jgi:type IV secretion system protein VirD4